MRLRVKKLVHLIVILLALIETFTGAVVDCVVCTIFYSTSSELDVSTSSYYYFTAHLLPTKHFYRLIIVLYVPILYLWRSHGVVSPPEGSSAGSEQGCLSVLGVICTRFPRHILPATAGWLWQSLRALQSAAVDASVVDNSDAYFNWRWLRQPLWYEDRKSIGELVPYRGHAHNSVLKQYNTRVCYIDCYI